jgi:hypothetical protein
MPYDAYNSSLACFPNAAAKCPEFVYYPEKKDGGSRGLLLVYTYAWSPAAENLHGRRGGESNKQPIKS